MIFVTKWGALRTTTWGLIFLNPRQFFVLLIKRIIDWQLTSYLKGTKTSKHSLFSLHLHYKNIQPLRWVLVHLLETTQHRRCQTGDKHAEDILSGLLTSIHKHTKYLKSCLLPSYFEIMASVSLGSPQGAKGSSELPGEMLENGMPVQCHSRKSNGHCQAFSDLILQSLTWWQINCMSL